MIVTMLPQMAQVWTAAMWLCSGLVIWLIACEFAPPRSIRLVLFKGCGVSMMLSGLLMAVVALYLVAFLPDCSAVPWWFFNCWERARS